MLVNAGAPTPLVDGPTMPVPGWGGNANEYLSDGAGFSAGPS
jgi:hypothetical protein